MRLDRGVTLVGSLLAILSGHPLDWLGPDLQVGQFDSCTRRSRASRFCVDTT